MNSFSFDRARQADSVPTGHGIASATDDRDDGRRFSQCVHLAKLSARDLCLRVRSVESMNETTYNLGKCPGKTL
jgi:hypothetical protein